MPDPSPQTDEVHVIREVHLNYSQDQPVRGPLTDKDAAAAFLRGVISDTTREHAVAIYLDPKNRPLGWRIVSIGTDVMAPVKPLLVLQPAVLLGANAMIFAHNHPSGDLEPSPKNPPAGTGCTRRPPQAVGAARSIRDPFDGAAKAATKRASESSPIGWRSAGTLRKAGRPRPLKSRLWAQVLRLGRGGPAGAHNHYLCAIVRR